MGDVFAGNSLLAAACCQSGQSCRDAYDGNGLTQFAAQVELAFQIAYLSLAGRAGTQAVALMFTLARLVLDVVSLRYLSANILQRLADFLSSFHIGWL